MRKLLFVITALVIAITTYAQQPADKIIGIWESTNSDTKLKFEIYKSGDKYFGKLLWASNMFEADGKTPKKDYNNPNKKLQTRSRKGIVNVNNLKFENDEYTGGTLYNPTDGNTYSLNAKLISANNLNFRGYKGVSLLGKTMKFKRIQ